MLSVSQRLGNITTESYVHELRFYQQHVLHWPPFNRFMKPDNSSSRANSDQRFDTGRTYDVRILHDNLIPRSFEFLWRWLNSQTTQRDLPG